MTNAVLREKPDAGNPHVRFDEGEVALTNAVLREKPDAGNPHVRFDEGEVALAATPRRGSLLYKIRQPFVAASLLAMSASCVLCAFADVKYELPAMHILVDGKSVQAKRSAAAR